MPCRRRKFTCSAALSHEGKNWLSELKRKRRHWLERRRRLPISAAGNQPAPFDWRSKPPNNKSVNRSLSFLFLATFVSLSCKFYSAPRPQRPCVVIKSKKQQWFTDFSSSPIETERRGGEKTKDNHNIIIQHYLWRGNYSSSIKIAW